MDNVVSEGACHNIFFVRGHMLITPPLADCIMDGVTRDTILLLESKKLESFSLLLT